MIARDFDNWAPSYDASALQPAYRAAHDAVLSHAKQLLGHPRRILDIGCGTGRLLRTAADLFPQATLVGVDMSAAMLSIASAAAPMAGRLAWVHAAAERLPVADMAFDLVVSTASFPHWADHHAAIGEIRRALAADGLFGMADLSSPRRHAPTIRNRRRHPAPLATSVAAAGLRIVKTATVPGFGPVTAITVIFAHRTTTTP